MIRSIRSRRISVRSIRVIIMFRRSCMCRSIMSSMIIVMCPTIRMITCIIDIMSRVYVMRRILTCYYYLY